MVISILSNIFTNNKAVEGVSKIKNEIADTAEKHRTGMRFNDTEALLDKNLLKSYCDMITTLNEVDAIEATNINVDSILNAQQNIITRFQGKVAELGAMIRSFDASTRDVNINDIAEQTLREIALTLNKTVNGSFLFAGITSDIPPIEDVNKFIDAPADLNGKITTDYTKLIKNRALTQIDLVSEIDLNIDATNSAFATMIAALRVMKTIQPTDLNGKEKIIKMFDDAGRLLSNLTVSIGSNQKIMLDAKDNIFDTKCEMENKAEYFKSHLEELFVETQEQKLRMQAMLKTIADAFNNMSLADYIKR